MMAGGSSIRFGQAPRASIQRRGGLSANAGWLVLLLAAGCGRDEQAWPGHALLPGRDVSTAPLTPTRPDPGILKDQTAYQPVPVPPAAGAPASEAGQVAAAPADEPVRAFLRDLAARLQKADVLGALEMFEPDHVAALQKDPSAVIETFEKAAVLMGLLEEKFGMPVAQIQAAAVQTAEAQQRIEMLDADHAQVSPALLLAELLGPRTPPHFEVTRTGQGWRIRLPAALSEEDVAEIVQFHRRAQQRLDRTNEVLESGETTDLAEAMRKVQAALQAPADMDQEPPEGQEPPAGGGP